MDTTDMRLYISLFSHVLRQDRVAARVSVLGVLIAVRLFRKILHGKNHESYMHVGLHFTFTK